MSKKKILEDVQVSTGLDPVDVAAGEKKGNWDSLTQFRRAAFDMEIESLTTNAVVTLKIQEADDTSGTNSASLKSKKVTATSAGAFRDEIEVNVESLSGSAKLAVRPTVNTDETTTISTIGTVVTIRGDARYRPADL